jgi:flavin reductase
MTEPFGEKLPTPEPINLDEVRALRSVLGMFATGITVVTALGGGVPAGMTANSFTSVSTAPPLVLVCVLRDAKVHEAILASEAFGVSVLSAQQMVVAKHFANKQRPRGDHEFDVVDWFPGRHTGTPIVSNTLAWLECKLDNVYEGGDHSIFLGRVLDSGRDASQDALLFFGGGYHYLERKAG